MEKKEMMKENGMLQVSKYVLHRSPKSKKHTDVTNAGVNGVGATAAERSLHAEVSYASPMNFGSAKVFVSYADSALQNIHCLEEAVLGK
jgi:hypothetical protein